MRDWTVTLDVITDIELDDILDNIFDELAGHSAAVAGVHDELTATLTLADDYLLDAAGRGLDILTEALSRHGARIVHTIAVECMTVAEQDRRLSEPTIPQLVGAAEVGEMLGVSRQRVHQLHTSNPRFPAPVVEVRMGPLWTWASIEVFDESWTRKPGRPTPHAVVGFELDRAARYPLSPPRTSPRAEST